MKTRTRTSRRRMFIAAMAVLGLLAAACGDDDVADETTTTRAATTTQAPATTEVPAAPEAPVTQGPGGEVATPSGEIVLSADEMAEVQAGGYTAALLWHTAGAFTDAVSQGRRLGRRVCSWCSCVRGVGYRGDRGDECAVRRGAAGDEQ